MLSKLDRCLPKEFDGYLQGMNYIATAIYEMVGEDTEMCFRITYGLLMRFRVLYSQQDMHSV